MIKHETLKLSEIAAPYYESVDVAEYMKCLHCYPAVERALERDLTPEAIAEIEEAEREFDAGGGRTLEEVLADPNGPFAHKGKLDVGPS